MCLCLWNYFHAWDGLCQMVLRMNQSKRVPRYRVIYLVVLELIFLLVKLIMILSLCLQVMMNKFLKYQHNANLIFKKYYIYRSLLDIRCIFLEFFFFHCYGVGFSLSVRQNRIFLFKCYLSKKDWPVDELVGEESGGMFLKCKMIFMRAFSAWSMISVG